MERTLNRKGRLPSAAPEKRLMMFSPSNEGWSLRYEANDASDDNLEGDVG